MGRCLTSLVNHPRGRVCPQGLDWARYHTRLVNQPLGVGIGLPGLGMGRCLTRFIYHSQEWGALG